MSQAQGEQSSTEVTEPGNVDSVSAGERLKKARLTLGLSVSDVSSRLKLSSDKIESFERGEVADIATPVFVAGYLRSYARLVELPEDELLADFDVLSSGQSSAGEVVSDDSDFNSAPFESMGSPSNGMIFTKLSSSRNSYKSSSLLLITVALSVLVIAAVYFFLLDEKSADDARVVPVTTSKPETASRLLDNDPMEVAETTPAMASPTAEASSAVNEVPAVAEVPPVTATSFANNEADPVNETGQGESKVEASPRSELILVFNDDSWAEVTDARGKRLVYRLAKAGMSHTVTGVAPFRVQLGYVPGVEIFYNGVLYDLSRFTGRRSAQFNVGAAKENVAGE